MWFITYSKNKLKKIQILSMAKGVVKCYSYGSSETREKALCKASYKQVSSMYQFGFLSVLSVLVH